MLVKLEQFGFILEQGVFSGINQLRTCQETIIRQKRITDCNEIPSSKDEEK